MKINPLQPLRTKGMKTMSTSEVFELIVVILLILFVLFSLVYPIEKHDVGKFTERKRKPVKTHYAEFTPNITADVQKQTIRDKISVGEPMVLNKPPESGREVGSFESKVLHQTFDDSDKFIEKSKSGREVGV